MSPDQGRGKQNRSDSSVFAKVELENWERFRRGGSGTKLRAVRFPDNYDIPTPHNIRLFGLPRSSSETT